MFRYNEASYLEKAIEKSLQKLKNENIGTRCAAAQELGNLENSNCPMVETALLKAMENDKSGIVRTMAAEVLGKLEIQCSTPFVVTDLSKVSQIHHEPFVQNVATEALEALGVKKRYAVKRKLCSLKKIENGNNIEKKYKLVLNLEQSTTLLFYSTSQKSRFYKNKLEKTQPASDFYLSDLFIEL